MDRGTIVALVNSVRAVRRCLEKAARGDESAREEALRELDSMERFMLGDA